jgi:predicted transcriptional regulator
MDLDPLAQIEADAAARGVEIGDALKVAGVAVSTWWRWKEGKFEPRASTVRRIREAIEQRAA